ncbi:MAG TPA: hypothetical protein VFF54_05280 [Thermodesulfobacteriota bacterium]|nr:hypothetical protein [Thermodesulfobacteriota bacterium]
MFVRALIILLLFVSASGGPAHAGDFVIIVNPDGPLKNADAGDIKEIYLGEKRFADSVKLVPINHVEGQMKNAFLKNVVGMDSKEYRLYWIKKVFQEGIPIPPSIGNVSAIINMVKIEKGAVAYVPEGVADGKQVGIIKFIP